jgi:hypothetical protein
VIYRRSRLWGGLRNIMAAYTPMFEWFMERQASDLTDDLFERL